ILPDDLRILIPSAVDPGVRAHDESIRVREEKRAPGRRDLAALGNVVPERQFADESGIALHVACDLLRRRRESGVRPDDLRSGIVAEQKLERCVVAMRVQPEVPLDCERDDSSYLYASGIAAVDVKLPDAAVAWIAAELGLDQYVDLGIVEPCRDVGARPVRT